MAKKRVIDAAPKVVPEGAMPYQHRAPRRGPKVGFIAILVVVVVGVLFALPPEPRLAWEQGTLPRSSLNVESLITTAEGFAVLAGPGSSGGAILSTTDGARWLTRTLPRVSTRIVYHSNGLYVVDGLTLRRVGPDADDAIVNVEIPGPVRIGNGSDRSGLMAVLGGLVVQTVDGDLFWSSNGRGFELSIGAADWRAESDVTVSPRVVPEVVRRRVQSVCQPAARRAPDIPPIVEAGDQVVAFVAKDDSSIVWPACEPVLWTSTDGTDWSLLSETSPFPPGAYVYDVAWRAGRFVAVGGIGLDEAHAWTSLDGAVWEELELPSWDGPLDLINIEAGGLGWVLMGNSRDRVGRVGWYSADGTCWEPLPPGVGGQSIAVGEDRILLADRTPESVIWVGQEAGSFSPLRRCA